MSEYNYDLKITIAENVTTTDAIIAQIKKSLEKRIEELILSIGNTSGIVTLEEKE